MMLPEDELPGEAYLPLDRVRSIKVEQIATQHGEGHCEYWVVIDLDGTQLKFGPQSIRHYNAQPQPTACPRCGHTAEQHSDARENDYQCMVARCPCVGWPLAERPAEKAA